MKRIFIVAAAALLGTCCNRTAETPRTQPPKNVFAKGSLLENNPNFSGEAWLEMFVTAADSMDCTVGNVTFAPGAICNVIAGVLYVALALAGITLLCKKILKVDMSEMRIPRFKVKGVWLIAAVLMPALVLLISILTGGHWEMLIQKLL